MSVALALDIGTSTLKSSLIDDSGSIRALKTCPSPTISPGIVNPEQVWSHTARLIRDTLDSCDDVPDAIIASGQGDGCWELGNDGNGRNSLTWNSTHASGVIDEWERTGVVAQLYRQTGTVIWPGTSAPILRWLRESHGLRPEDLAAILTAKDWIDYRLTGVITTDITDASIPFVNPYTRKLDHDLLDLLECADFADAIPEPRRPGSLIGRVDKRASALSGIVQGTPVYLGSLDCVASTRGAGAHAMHDTVASLGTTSAVFSLVHEPVPEGKPVGATIVWPEPGLFLRVLGSSSGAQVLEWFLREFGYHGPRRYLQFWQDVDEAKEHDELFLPFLFGERAPFLAPNATGTFMGISSRTTRPRLAAAVADGIAFSMRHCLESSGQISDIVLTGGGTSDPHFCQLIANTLSRPVLVDSNAQLGTIGVASFIPGFEALSHRSVERTTFTPQGDGEDAQRRFNRYLESISASLPLWKERK
ncbi:FGGY family carbohydrate kinase [Bifidobacterium sp.]|uniref:FGGY family carbohydrate kinase n=1 Tax=Bifidobacterium sp. TaxID=41200 RepID=UPI0039ED07CC